MILTASDLYKKYGGQLVLNGVSLSVGEGECVGIIGRNGCGKSTLLSILVGVEKADSGSVTGVRQTGYLPQINPLLDDATVYENLGLWARSRQNIKRVITDYDLYDIKNKKVSKLSGGMKRRLAIACAMVNAPKVLIMDEPTTALDIEYKELIHQEMRSYIEKGNSIILVTHEKEEMEMCDRMYSLIDGELVLISKEGKNSNGK